MRKGEAAALQWSDINFKNITIEVNKSLDFKAKTDDNYLGIQKIIIQKELFLWASL